MQDKTAAPLFISHLHAFRGFAIINIVAVHAWAMPFASTSSPRTSPLHRWYMILNEVTFHDGTLYFALISGLLFSLVLARKGWHAFFRSKLHNVVSPYVVMTLVFTGLSWNLGGGPRVFGGTIAQYAGAVGTNLLLGSAMFQFWYIPVLLVLFVLTPAVAYAVSRPRLRWLVWLAMLAPLLVSRSSPNQSVATVVYFLGAYSVGIYAGANYPAFLDLIDRFIVAIGVIAAATTALLLVVLYVDPAPIGVTSPAETLWYVQKLAFAAIVIRVLRRRDTALPRWMSTLADYAFAIFFFHGIVLLAATGVLALLHVTDPSALALFGCGLFLLVATLLLCVRVSIALRALLGRRSRRLIGA